MCFVLPNGDHTFQTVHLYKCIKANWTFPNYFILICRCSESLLNSKPSRGVRKAGIRKGVPFVVTILESVWFCLQGLTRSQNIPKTPPPCLLLFFGFLSCFSWWCGAVLLSNSLLSLSYVPRAETTKPDMLTHIVIWTHIQAQIFKRVVQVWHSYLIFFFSTI